jgi:hypothetical protein
LDPHPEVSELFGDVFFVFRGIHLTSNFIDNPPHPLVSKIREDSKECEVGGSEVRGVGYVSVHVL